jgi:hypothetical protein
MTKPSRGRYLTRNRSGYSAALRKRGSLLIWLDTNDRKGLLAPRGNAAPSLVGSVIEWPHQRYAATGLPHLHQAAPRPY